MKQEKIREKQLAEQREARRQKNATKKEKRINKKLEALGALKKGPIDVKESDQPSKKQDQAAKDASKKSPPKQQTKQAAAPEKLPPK